MAHADQVHIEKCECGRRVYCEAFRNYCDCGEHVFNFAGQEIVYRTDWDDCSGDIY